MKDHYEFNEELHNIVECGRSYNRSRQSMNLFRFSREIYSVDEEAIENNSHKYNFENKDTLRKYL